jgi:hypothetical protein
MEEWKKYNVKTIDEEDDYCFMTKEVDRLGRIHGKIFVWENKKRKEFIYVNNVLQWWQVTDHECIRTQTYVYLAGDVYTNGTDEYYSGRRDCFCHKNDVNHGVIHNRYVDGSWLWLSYSKGKTARQIKWSPEGALQYIYKF